MAMNAMSRCNGESSCAEASNECLICQEKHKRSAEKTFLPCATAQDIGECSCGELLDECIICHEGYKSMAEKAFLPCAHYFHKDCIDQWLEAHNACPVCRNASTKDTFPAGPSLLTDDASSENDDDDAFNIYLRSARCVGIPDAHQRQQMHQAANRTRQAGKEMHQSAERMRQAGKEMQRNVKKCEKSMKYDWKKFEHDMERMSRKLERKCKALERHFSK